MKFGYLVYWKRKGHPKLVKSTKKNDWNLHKKFPKQEDWHWEILSNRKKNSPRFSRWLAILLAQSNYGDIVSKRKVVGGSVMVWGGVRLAGKTDRIICRQSFECYRLSITTWTIFFSPIRAHWRLVLQFQEDNAPVLTTKSTFDGFWIINSINIINWSPCSPNLNPEGNTWGKLAIAEYARAALQS